MKEIIVKQKVSNQELGNLAEKIIKLLDPLNYAEKYKLIDALLVSLKEAIQESGGMIIEGDKND